MFAHRVPHCEPFGMIGFDPVLMVALGAALVGFPLLILIFELVGHFTSRSFMRRDRERRLIDLHLFAEQLKGQARS